MYSREVASSVDYTVFFFNDTATTEIYTLSLHDALPICLTLAIGSTVGRGCRGRSSSSLRGSGANPSADRKSTRLNSSHLVISYAVFCLKKKKNPSPHLASATSERVLLPPASSTHISSTS